MAVAQLVVVKPEAAAPQSEEPAAVEHPEVEALPGPEARPAAAKVLTVTAPAPGGPLEAAAAPVALRRIPVASADWPGPLSRRPEPVVVADREPVVEHAALVDGETQEPGHLAVGQAEDRPEAAENPPGEEEHRRRCSSRLAAEAAIPENGGLSAFPPSL